MSWSLPPSQCDFLTVFKRVADGSALNDGPVEPKARNVPNFLRTAAVYAEEGDLAGVGRVIRRYFPATGWPMGVNCVLRRMAGAGHSKLYGRGANGNAPVETAWSGPDVRSPTVWGAVPASSTGTTNARG